MKKKILITALIFFQQYCFGQTASQRSKTIRYIVPADIKITVGQEIKPGRGTKDNGDFKFISVSRNSWMAR